MGFAPLAKALVISVGPRAGVSAQVSPQVKGMPQGFIAMPPEVDLVERTGLITDRRGAGVTLKGLGGFKALAIVAHFGQQARRDFGPRPR